MKIETQDYGQVTVVDLQGEFVEEYLDKLTDVANSLLSQEKQGVVLDMTKIGFVDSKGLECLLELREKCVEVFCQLKLAGLDENCKKILEITRLEDVFDCYDDISLAVRSYT